MKNKYERDRANLLSHHYLILVKIMQSDFALNLMILLKGNLSFYFCDE